MMEARPPVTSSSSLMTDGEDDAWKRDSGGVCGFDVVHDDDDAGELFENE